MSTRAQDLIEPGMPPKASLQPCRSESREPLTILVAEDDSKDALPLKLAFAQAGVNAPVHFVRDGVQAIDELLGVPPLDNRAKHPLPNLLVLDWKMPGVDGFEVLAWLRQEPASDRITVAMLSGSCLQAALHRAYALGANFWVAKPFDFDQLIAAVERLLEKHSLHLTPAPTDHQLSSPSRIPQPLI